ncbi:hypothetical protein ACFU66_38490, partial [Streptomyces libani]
MAGHDGVQCPARVPLYSGSPLSREVDADLGRQEASIRERRCRLGALLAEPPGATEPVSPALAALLA